MDAVRFVEVVGKRIAMHGKQDLGFAK